MAGPRPRGTPHHVGANRHNVRFGLCCAGNGTSFQFEASTDLKDNWGRGTCSITYLPQESCLQHA
jgi:hypothetical protein